MFRSRIREERAVPYLDAVPVPGRETAQVFSSAGGRPAVVAPLASYTVGRVHKDWDKDPAATGQTGSANGAVEVPEYRYDYVPGSGGEARADEPSRRPEVLRGRGSRGPLERVWPRLPLTVTRLAGTIAYRYL